VRSFPDALDIACLVVGDYSAAPDAGAPSVWAIIDAISRSFLPTAATVAAGPVTINNVRYAPADIQQITLENSPDRCCVALKLATMDPMAAKTDPAAAPEVPAP
jgi:hypothetical protein